ncbi:MAG: hypothetical protein J6J00_05180 [Treponema sp.]|nr:hypothetical protein [Treponema sp.]
MALTNNEKQIRHKQLEKLKKYGNEVLVQLIFMNSGIGRPIEKTNEEIKAEIDSIVNLPSGWTEEDYNLAVQKLKNMNITALSNPHLMNNDINYRERIYEPDYIGFNISKIEYKAAEVVRNIQSTLKLSELKKTDQIAAVAEVMRRLAVELLSEKIKPKTFANATALSLIDQNYEKPEWVYEVLAQNLFLQNGKDNAKKIAKALTSTEIENKGGFV